MAYAMIAKPVGPPKVGPPLRCSHLQVSLNLPRSKIVAGTARPDGGVRDTTGEKARACGARRNGAPSIHTLPSLSVRWKWVSELQMAWSKTRSGGALAPSELRTDFGDTKVLAADEGPEGRARAG